MNILISAFVALAVSLGSLFFAPKPIVPPVINNPPTVPEIRYITEPPSTPVASPVLGADATNPIAGTNYYLAGSGVSASASSITLTSLTIPQTGHAITDSELSDTFYITIEPGSRTRQEVASCTTVTQNAGGTATLSGCSRGLLPFTPFTASTTYQFAHGGGTAVVFSNPPQLYNEFLGKGNAGYITGVHTYASSAVPRASSTPNYIAGTELWLATKAYVDAVATSGAPDASITTKGLSQLATKTNLAVGSSTGAGGALLVPWSADFNATSSATTTVPVTGVNGKLSQGFLDLTQAFTFSGGVTSTGALNLNGNLTVTASSTFASSTFSQLPFITSSTPTLAGQATPKDYVDKYGHLTLATTSISAATPTSTLAITMPYTGRLLVNFEGTMSDTTAGRSGTMSLKVDGTIPASFTSITVSNVDTGGSATGSKNASFMYISDPITAGAHLINVSTTCTTVGACTYAGAFQAIYFGQ